MKRLLRGALVSLALALAACGSPTDSGDGAPNLGRVGEDGDPSYVAVEATGKKLKITNLTDEKIGYSVLEANVVFIAIIPPCSNPNDCPSLGPHETVEVPYEEITGIHEGSTEAIVNAWNYVPDREHGTRVGVMTQTRVRL